MVEWFTALKNVNQLYSLASTFQHITINKSLNWIAMNINIYKYIFQELEAAMGGLRLN